MAIYPLTMAGLVPLPKQCSHENQSTHVLGRVPSNGNLPYNYGRTSPPTKTILARARLDKSPPPARLFALTGVRFIGRGYLIIAICPLTMAGLVPLPKQCSHVNQSTYVYKSLI